ncbi:MAG: branched-chain amino acid transaminase, partial [Anaerolineales bacterium]|nr:branched-chain amino acid transaminase [Anaerolineales bacterium]
TPRYAYFQGKIVPYAEAKVGVMTHALNYGTAVFGGVRAYWNDDEAQLFIFRPLDHYTRFLNSAKLLWMHFDHTPESLTALTVELLRREGEQQDMYIRPLAYKSAEAIGVRLHDLPADLTIFAVPFGRYVDNEEGTHATFSSWRRVDDNSIPARGKISGSYVNSAFIKTDAMLAGYDEAIVLNQAGHVSEGSAENLFMLRGGVVVTPPVTEDVLEGITRRTLMTLLRDEMGLEVHERVIDRSEVYLADELWFCGTGVQVAAITRVDHRPIGNGKMGPVVGELRKLYFDVVRGKVAKYRHWNQPVFVKEAVAAD